MTQPPFGPSAFGLRPSRRQAGRTDSLRQHALVALASAIGEPNLSLKSLAGTLDATFEIPYASVALITLVGLLLAALGLKHISQ